MQIRKTNAKLYEFSFTYRRFLFWEEIKFFMLGVVQIGRQFIWKMSAKKLVF